MSISKPHAQRQIKTRHSPISTRLHKPASSIKVSGMAKSAQKPKPKRADGRSNAGRPTKYDPAYCEQARKLCLLGFTNDQLAKFFEVATSTIELWIKTHPEFSGAIKAGGVNADAEVAASLYHRAIGYSHEAVKIFNDQGSPLVVPYTEHYPPETAAAFIWLKNRQRWRDRPADDTPAPETERLAAVKSVAQQIRDAVNEMEKLTNGPANPSMDPATPASDTNTILDKPASV